MVHSIFKCLVEKNSYSKTIILTEIFIIIRLLSISNKALKYFLNHTKTFKGKWHHNETPPVYSYWTKALSCKFSEWCNIVHTTFCAPKLPEKINFFNLGATLDLPRINMKNQNKPNVCQSLVLQVYFKKKVLWIAGCYLFGLYNNNNFGPTHYISHIFVFSKSNMADLTNFENLKNSKIWNFSGGIPSCKFPDT